jgi:two-component system phosphate regulon sensor histidine kinase PhoR
MSHEFKTPIATINLALDAISNPKSILIPEKIERYVVMIREENNRMLSQVENVLRISQLERSSDPLKKTKVNLHLIIEEAVGHIELILADKFGTLTKKYNASKTDVYGNRSHLVNVIVNLLDNALKYCENTPKIILETTSDENYFILTIKDNGIGMNPSTQKKIFDKFYRETSGNIHNVKGHGLGLAYVKKIVDFHKGEIKLISKEDEGTIFSISLPIDQKI